MIDAGEAIRRVALNVARYTGIAPLAAPYFAGCGAILMLHHVTRTPGRALGVNRHLSITPEFLAGVIEDLQRAAYTFVSIDEAVDRLRSGRGGRFLALTADDGYRDNVTEALPVLESHDVPIMIYVSPRLVEHEVDLWWEVMEEVVTRSERIDLRTPKGSLSLDCRTMAQKASAVCRLHEHLTTTVGEDERQATLRDLALRAGIDPVGPSVHGLLDWSEIRAASQHRLVTFGAHSVSHYNLRRLDDEAAYREIADAAGLIETETGNRPRHMAYPYGYASAVGAREVAMAREAGYASAVTTRHGVLRPQHAGHLHALPRISVNGRYQKPAHIRTMLSGITTAMTNSGRRLVTV